jgi:hypothetical protein
MSGDGAYQPCKASWASRPYDYCGEPATVPVTVACVHEHVRPGHACPEHAASLDEHFCALCFHADGHRCRLVVMTASGQEHAHG